MEVISRRSSSLNPNAPLFVPCAYRVVEDFSDKWWELVHSSTWFRDYWLQECFQDPQNAPEDDHNDDIDLLSEIDALFDGYTDSREEDKEKAYPKFVNVKVIPMVIQQPR